MAGRRDQVAQVTAARPEFTSLIRMLPWKSYSSVVTAVAGVENAGGGPLVYPVSTALFGRSVGPC